MSAGSCARCGSLQRFPSLKNFSAVPMEDKLNCKRPLRVQGRVILLLKLLFSFAVHWVREKAIRPLVQRDARISDLLKSPEFRQCVTAVLLFFYKNDEIHHHEELKKNVNGYLFTKRYNSSCRVCIWGWLKCFLLHLYRNRCCLIINFQSCFRLGCLRVVSLHPAVCGSCNYIVVPFDCLSSAPLFPSTP